MSKSEEKRKDIQIDKKIENLGEEVQTAREEQNDKGTEAEQEYSFPEHGKTIKAKNLDEAKEKLAKELDKEV